MEIGFQHPVDYDGRIRVMENLTNHKTTVTSNKQRNIWLKEYTLFPRIMDARLKVISAENLKLSRVPSFLKSGVGQNATCMLCPLPGILPFWFTQFHFLPILFNHVT